MYIETLPNALIRICDRASGLSGLYNPDGSYRSGFRFANGESLVNEYMGWA